MGIGRKATDQRTPCRKFLTTPLPYATLRSAAAGRPLQMFAAAKICRQANKHTYIDRITENSYCLAASASRTNLAWLLWNVRKSRRPFRRLQNIVS